MHNEDLSHSLPTIVIANIGCSIKLSLSVTKRSVGYPQMAENILMAPPAIWTWNAIKYLH